MHTQATIEAGMAFDLLTTAGVLMPGAWFYAPRGARLNSPADRSAWASRIDYDGSAWKPVGGPPVGARVVYRPGVCEFVFDQECHPFGARRLHQMSIAYQAVDPYLIRLWIPRPQPLSRISLAAPASREGEPFELLFPGSLSGGS